MDRETEEAIGEALGGNPRAVELAEMIAALEVRKETFERERGVAPGDEAKKSWAQRINEVDRQIQMLQQELAITDFVERSVRVAASRPRPMLDEEDLY